MKIRFALRAAARGSVSVRADRGELPVSRKSHRLSADRKGYKAGRFTYLLRKRAGPGEVSVPMSGGGGRAALPT
jgi:hypothetical protein